MANQTAIDRQAAEAALAKVQETQTAFWNAMNDLEAALGGRDLDSSEDFEGMVIDDFLQEEEAEYRADSFEEDGEAYVGDDFEEWFSKEE